MEPGQQPSWQAPARKRVHARLARDVRRITIVVTVLVLSVALLWMLLPPFFAPQTHLVLIGSQANASFNAPLLPFVAEDFQAFKTIAEANVHDQSDRWRSAPLARTIAAGLNSTGVSTSDNLVVYLNAHGTTEGSKAFLLCNDFDLRQPDTGRIAIEKFLSQIRQSPAAVKLVLLNAGSIDRDTGMGIVGNDFPRLLEQAVVESNDPSLWVYCSHSSLQYSHVSRAAERSVFGMFVAEAFKGAADLNQDRTINLSELVGFTSANVSHWVAQQSDRSAQQTPNLYWGGGRSPSPDPPLLALFDDQPTGPLTVSALLGDADETAVGSTALARTGPTQGMLRRQRVTLASNRMPIADGTQDAAVDGQGPSKVVDSSSDPSPKSDSASTSSEPAAATTDPPNPSIAPAAASAGDQAQQRLSLAWRQRDEGLRSWSAADPNSSPIENKPHLWRELQAELLSFEQQLSGGKGYQISEIAQTLREALTPSPPVGTPSRSPLMEMFHTSGAIANTECLSLAQPKFHSAAISEMSDRIQGLPIAVEMDNLLDALNQPTREAFAEWFKTRWNPQFAQYVELATLRRLSEASELDWPLVQAVAKTCIEGERAAALDLMLPHFLRDRVARADQLRFFAEQLVFDQIGIEWQQRTIVMLQEADSIYRSAQTDFAEIRAAQRIQELLLARVPYYLHWYRMDKVAAKQVGGDRFADLSLLLDRLAEMTDLLDRPETTNVDDLVTLRDGLAALQTRIEKICGDDAAQQLLDRAEVPGDSYQAECLLATPLLTATMRGKLLETVRTRDRQLAVNFDLALVASTDFNERFAQNHSSMPSLDQWRQVIKQAELETKYVCLCDARLSNGLDLDLDTEQTPTTEQHSGSVQHARHQLRNAYQVLESALAKLESSSNPTEVAYDDSSMDAITILWQAHADFCQQLKTFYHSALELEDSNRPCNESIAQTNAVSRLLRMVDARDAWRLANVDVHSLTVASRLRSTLLWHASRFEQASMYQHDQASQPLVSWAESYRMLSERMCRARQSQENAATVLVTGPDRVDLQYIDGTEFVIELKNPLQETIDVMVAMDYEPELIDVVAKAAVDSIPGTESNQRTAPRFIEGRSLFGTRRMEPFSITAGGSVTLALRLSRHSNATESTKLVVDVFAQSNLTTLDALPPALLTRQSIDVTLPVAELVIEQGEQLKVSGANGLELTPYPNRTESFRIGVVNRSSRTKPVTIKCFALNQPTFDFSDAQQNARRLAAKPLATFELSASGEGQPAYPGAPIKTATPDSSGDDGNQPSPVAAVPAASEPIESIEMPFGMLVALIDGQTGQTTFRKIGYSVQRPRRFVSPRVGFDVNKRQIQIEVVAANQDRFPAGAPIRVECRLADDVDGRTAGKMQGLLTKSNPIANLFISMTTPPTQVVRVVIDVDGYPRAFVYDVPCGKQVSDVPEIVDLVELQMTTASTRGVLAATKSIPVALRLDAPVGAFEKGTDYLDIGLDLDESGIPAPEDRVRLTTDRAVRVGFIRATPDGKMDLINEVSDHLIDLPADRLENLRLDIAAALTLNGSARVFPSMELLIDTAPPIVGPAIRTDGLDFVGVNQSVDFDVWAWDDGSDVTSVQATFDLDGSGEFPAAGNFFSASRTSNRQWVLTVDVGADAGKKVLLVRGTDRVGNASEPISIDIEVVSAAENENRVRQQTVELTGSIQFRENAVAQAEIRLTAVAKETPPTSPPTVPTAQPLVAQSAENGSYRIAGVAPGNYLLETRAVIRNRVHRTEKAIEVAVGPDRKLRIDVVLP